MSVLVVSKILRHFVNTLTPDENYSHNNRGNLKQTIQIQLSLELKTFCQYCTAFLKSPFNFELLEKKVEPHSLCISKITDIEMSKWSQFSTP